MPAPCNRLLVVGFLLCALGSALPPLGRARADEPPDRDFEAVIAAIANGQGDRRQAQLLVMAVDHADSAVRRRALSALSRAAASSEQAGRELAQTLLELEQRADLRRQCRFLDALGSLGKHGQSAVPRLREIIGGDQANERFARTRAAVALTRIQDERDEGLRLLITWSRVDDPLTRWLAVDGLGRLPAPLPREAIDAVRERLDDDNVTVRTVAAMSLVTLKVDVPAAVDVLIGALGKRPSAVYFEPPGLLEEGPDTWHWAMATLAHCGPHAAKAIPTLAGVLSHEDESYRDFALQTLGKLGPTARGALPEIERCSRQDRSPRIRKAAEQAIQAIGSDLP